MLYYISVPRQEEYAIFSVLNSTICTVSEGSSVKNLPAKAGDTKDKGSIPGSGRSPGGGMATHSRILAWEIARTEEPCRPQSVGLQRVGHD